jgi:hypothetical protein
MLVFWVVCGLAGKYQHFRGTYTASIFRAEMRDFSWSGEGPFQEDWSTRGWGGDVEIVWVKRKHPYTGNQRGRLGQEKKKKN